MLNVSSTAPTPRPAASGFEDGFGRRFTTPPRVENDPPLEILCFRRELTEVPSFEFALRERVARLADFRHPDFVRIRRVDRLNDQHGTVALLSDRPSGVRLSEMLAVDASRRVRDLDASMSLIRRLTSALAALHEQARVAHGTLTPERLFVTPSGGICIVEHVMGSALEQLKYSRERCWKELRVPLPSDIGLPKIDARADLTQVAIIALSLALARPLREDEYPGHLDEVVAAAPPALHGWLKRALQLDPRTSFQSMAEAHAALESPAIQIRPEAPEAVEDPADKLDVEEQLDMTPTRNGQRSFGRFKWMAAGLFVMVATTGGLYAARSRFLPSAAPATGTVAVTSNPPGALVEIDGEARGQTPISMVLTAGSHALVVRGQGEPRRIPITVTAGAQISQYLDLPKAGAAVGQLQVRTEPGGARISVDGIALGRTPVTVADLSPGDHTVTLEGDQGAVTQNVTIEAGVTASLVVPMAGAPGAAAPGWISVTAPFVMDLYEHGRLLGTTGIDRLMVPAGKHEIELVSGALGYRETRTLQVTAGRVSTISVTLPKGAVSINAIPWATVSIDGESVGDTPIGNLPLTIGSHEVVFRNPQLGEQRRVVIVTQQATTRVSVDLTKK